MSCHWTPCFLIVPFSSFSSGHFTSKLQAEEGFAGSSCVLGRKKAAIVVEILITWLLGFEFTGCFLSRAQRRGGRRVGIIFSQERGRHPVGGGRHCLEISQMESARPFPEGLGQFSAPPPRPFAPGDMWEPRPLPLSYLLRFPPRHTQPVRRPGSWLGLLSLPHQGHAGLPCFLMTVQRTGKQHGDILLAAPTC